MPMPRTAGFRSGPSAEAHAAWQARHERRTCEGKTNQHGGDFLIVKVQMNTNYMMIWIA